MERPLHDVTSSVAQTPNTRRAIALVFVGIIHAALVWALVVGLATGVIQKSVEEIKVAVERPKAEKIPLPPPPTLEKPAPPVVPPPEIVVQQPAPAAINIQTHAIQPTPSAPAEVSSPIGIGRAHTCGSKYYPEMAQRLEQEGTTQVTFTVTANGDVVNPSVVNSSGYDSLDRAALPCVMSWKYKPAIQNGKPVAAQWTANVQWKVPR